MKQRIENDSNSNLMEVLDGLISHKDMYFTMQTQDDIW